MIVMYNDIINRLTESLVLLMSDQIRLKRRYNDRIYNILYEGNSYDVQVVNQQRWHYENQTTKRKRTKYLRRVFDPSNSLDGRD